jgi:hypothetical protein
MVGTRTKIDRWKTLFDYPNPAYLCMMNRGGISAGLSNLVGKLYNLCRVQTYSNRRVLRHGRLEWPYLTCVGFWFYKDVSKKMEKGVEWSTRRVLSWHEGILEYLEGTAEELGVVMFD